ncbi:amidohydrolase family protein [Dyadobacter endophyticus]
MATLNGATALGMNQSIGTIETEKAVDLLVVDSDPSKNIYDIRKV